jgi:hypothetical protein
MIPYDAGASRTGIIVLSNVLIGIIGVILFIGLALAGALFLGPRFQEATVNSKASAAVQAISQVSSAVRLYETQSGAVVTPATAGTTLSTTTENSYRELVAGGYLKTVPANPTNSGGVYVSRESGVNYVVMGVGVDNDAVCRQINKQAGAGDINHVLKTSATRTMGCEKIGTASPIVYIGWERI